MRAPSRSTVVRYGAALLTVALAAAVRLALDPVLGDQVPYATFLLAVAAAAYMGGAGPALLALAASGVASLPVVGGLPEQTSELVALGFFALCGLVIAYLGDRLADERERVEQAARYSAAAAERLELALEAGQMGVWEWDVRSGRVEWSENLYRIHGLPPGEFAGTLEAWGRLLHPADAGKVDGALRDALEERRRFDVEYRCKAVGADGLRWIHATGHVLRGGRGRPPRMLGTCTDVTERKREEEIARFLAQASDTLATLVDYESTLRRVAQLAVPFFADWCVVDMVAEDGAISRLATAHADPAKLDLIAEVNRRWPPDRRAPYGPANVVRTGRSELQRAIPERLLAELGRDPERLEMLRSLGLRSYIAVPIRIRGRVVGVISFVSAESGHEYDRRDLQVAEDLANRAAIAIENARLYAELREGARRKDEFLAMLGHELRNPLAAIQNALSLLELEHPPGEERALRRMMQSQLDQIVRLVDDLLDVARILHGRIELRKQEVELADVVRQAVETARPQIEAKRHRLDVRLPEEPIRLRADPVRLAQALSNLLANAARYTDVGGHLELVAEAGRDPGSSVPTDEVRLAVRDDGVGLAPQSLERVFDLFSQEPATAGGAREGLGIGLTLVRNLVEMHGGRVWAESDGLGQGSTFHLLLPTVRAAALLAREEHQPPAVESGLRILVVDDHADAARSLALLLSQRGHHDVRVAFDGASALEAARQLVPEIALVDLGLPDTSGYELAPRLRAVPGAERALLIAITGFGGEDPARRSREAGFDRHLVKPVRIHALEKILHEELQRRRLAASPQTRESAPYAAP